MTITIIIGWLVLGYIGSRATLLSMKEEFPDSPLDGSDYAFATVFVITGPIIALVAFLSAPRVFLKSIGIRLPKPSSEHELARKFWRV